MHRKNTTPVLSTILLILILLSSACSTFAPPVPTETPKPTLTPTDTATPTKTPKPTSTPRPTATPNLAATKQIEDLKAEAQAYYDQGFLKSPDGKFKQYDDYTVQWAQLNWYQWEPLKDTASDFYMRAHFKWQSAYRNADLSGCGFVFGLQQNSDHYAVFLDRTRILFLISNSSGTREVGKTRGTGRVKFDPGVAEADFALIVNDAYAYVLVDEKVVGEYTLSQTQPLRGRLALTVLSGTNKDYGTRCEMTELHAWIPE